MQARESFYQICNSLTGKGKYHTNSKLKDSEPGTSCSNESVDRSDIINNTSEGDNATPKKDIETGCSADGPGLITKNQPTSMVFPKTVFGKKERSFNANWYSKFPWLHCDIKSDSVY